MHASVVFGINCFETANSFGDDFKGKTEYWSIDCNFYNIAEQDYYITRVIPVMIVHVYALFSTS